LDANIASLHSTFGVDGFQMNKPEITITVNDLPQPVIKAIEGGRKIEAIKLLREATRLG